MLKKTAFTLSRRVAAKLKDLIKNGGIEGDFPSERALCERLSVGRGTLRIALQELETEGVISPPGTKSVRKITIPACDMTSFSEKKRRQRRQLIGVISTLSLYEIPQAMMIEIYQLRQLVAEDNFWVQIFEVLKTSKNAIELMLERVTKENPCYCWILYQAPEVVQLWFKKHELPCIVRGTTFPSANLPFLDRNWAATVQHAATYLWRRGHRRIMLCIPDKRLQGNKLMEDRFSKITLSGFEGTAVRVPQRAKDFIPIMNRIFDKKKVPTALIIVDAFIAIPLITWCYSRGITVPDNLSVISVSSHRFMHNLSPRFSIYADVNGRAARKMRQMIRAVIDGKTVRGRFIIPEFYAGETVREI